MPEFIVVNGERREVPAEIVAQGRRAVAAWHAQQKKPASSSTPSTSRKSTRTEE